VSTLAQRKGVTLWLIHEVNDTGTPHRIASMAVSKFKTIFNQTFLLRIFKSEFRERWELKRAELIMDGSYTSTG